MPNAALHNCAWPGCGELVPRGKARCQAHTRAHEARRGSARARGYSSRWERYRALFLQAYPLCAPCEAAGRVAAATVCDHIVAHKGDTSLFWDPANHQPSCKPCHDKRVDEGDFGR